MKSQKILTPGCETLTQVPLKRKYKVRQGIQRRDKTNSSGKNSWAYLAFTTWHALNYLMHINSFQACHNSREQVLLFLLFYWLENLVKLMGSWLKVIQVVNVRDGISTPGVRKQCTFESCFLLHVEKTLNYLCLCSLELWNINFKKRSITPLY